ncbi:hypothetical protein KTJ53_08245 [Acinetobacter variabilis]|uniref:DUF6615 family protein n=1 Tax=Acinetobacter variabilis TaxID=70346 RepID=UPI0021D2DB4C|nr:DUF6615 family protein [Acinetobacter variabilis]MCU4629687.1 hypothetical protein [Acinetobacter variabilis]
MSNCGLFKKLSKDTWRILSRAYNNHLTFGEDAITSIILDQIIENSNFSIVISDTRPKENTCGCDFEMWIGGKKGWYRYAIQAKKLDIGSQTYKSLHHTIGKLKIPQIDVLETYSKKVNAFPLYCLYNSNLNTPSKEDLYGCSIISISKIKKALVTRGTRSYRALRKDMIPWHYLVCDREKEKFKNFIDNSSYNSFYPELPDFLRNILKINNEKNSLKISYKKDINQDLSKIFKDLGQLQNDLIYPKKILIITDEEIVIN